FYKNQTVYDELSSFCAGDIDTIGYTEPSPNHICYALVTQDSEENPKLFLRTFVFEMPHDGERKSFSYFYPAYQKIAE
ncbi:MAG: hypothetical protein Q4E65_05310, partial [Clostridia bacterium]|nr:hypothetical protein [Clostridia bacterium]